MRALGELLFQLFHAKVDIAKNLHQKADRFAGMHRHNRCAPIRMSQEMMTALDTHNVRNPFVQESR